MGLLLLTLGLVIGYSVQPKAPDSNADAIVGMQMDAIYTCSMHPQIKLPKPGKCPICRMDLIPLKRSGTGQHQHKAELVMSEASMALAEIETSVVTRRKASVEVEMVGKVEVDNTRISDVVLLSDGEIRRLFVNYAGIPIVKGEHLAEIYSPQIYSAAQDFLVALRSQILDADLVQSAENKLNLLGAPREYIDRVKNEKRVPETFTLLSPRSGYVENVIGNQGMWIKAGQMLCRIIDMSQLWIMLDAYESDLAWIRYGQHVKITTASMPGVIIAGTISYIPPRLNDVTRTTKIRVNVENASGELKPGMFVSSTLLADVTANGTVTSAELKGKWICPMHPEIVKDKADQCDICSMKLVGAEKLGFNFDGANEWPLLLPETAVLLTGQRAVVYVRKDGKEPVFEGREVVLGPKAGAYYLVREGLNEGEQVVSKGNFKIDSALQIQAKPSMMKVGIHSTKLSNEMLSAQKMASLDSKKLRTSLAPMVELYLKIQFQLSHDQWLGLTELAQQFKILSDKADPSELSAVEVNLWHSLMDPVKTAWEHLPHQGNIDGYRKNFKQVSQAMIAMISKVGHELPTVKVVFCPMASASWLQTKSDIENPYFGMSMLNCGEIKHVLSAIPKQ